MNFFASTFLLLLAIVIIVVLSDAIRGRDWFLALLYLFIAGVLIKGSYSLYQEDMKPRMMLVEEVVYGRAS